MKKSNILKILMCTTLLGGALVAGTAAMKDTSVVVDASSYSSAEINVTGKSSWSAAEGTFVNVPNWKNSGLTISFEFKISIPEGKTNGMVFNLYSGDTRIDADNSYLIDKKNDGSQLTIDNIYLDRSGDTGRKVEIVDKANGWLRYEAQLSTFKAADGKASATLNRINFIWYASIVTHIRNMKVTSGLHKRFGDTPAPYNTFPDVGTLKGYGDNRDFVSIPNFKTSGLGFSFEFKPTNDVDSLIQVKEQPNSWRTLNSGNQYYYRKGNASAPTMGKLVVLADGWFRYELMCADIPLGTGITGTETLSIAYFATWAGEKYDCKPDMRNVRQISQYTVDAVTKAIAWADEFMSATDDVCDAAGKTVYGDLEDVWYDHNAAYNSLNADSKVLLTYTDMMGDATAKAKADAAIARYKYIAAKYPNLPNIMPMKVNANTSINTIDSNNKIIIIVVASTAVLMSLFAALVLTKKKRLNRK